MKLFVIQLTYSQLLIGDKYLAAGLTISGGYEMFKKLLVSSAFGLLLTAGTMCAAEVRGKKLVITPHLD